MVSKSLKSMGLGAALALNPLANAAFASTPLSKPMQEIVDYAKGHPVHGKGLYSELSRASRIYESDLKNYKILVKDSATIEGRDGDLVVSVKGKTGYTLYCDKGKDGRFDAVAYLDGLLSGNTEETIMNSFCDVDSLYEDFAVARNLGLYHPRLLYVRDGKDVKMHEFYDHSDNITHTGKGRAPFFQKMYTRALDSLRSSMRPARKERGR